MTTLKFVCTLFILYIFLHEILISTLKDLEWSKWYWVIMLAGFSTTLVVIWL